MGRAAARRPGSDAATAREEVFGPVITVVRARDADDALRITNGTEYGLSSAVFTQDADRGVRFALGVRAGITHVNDSPVSDVGTSLLHGTGRFGGQWAVEEFTTEHWVSVQHTEDRRRFP